MKTFKTFLASALLTENSTGDWELIRSVGDRYLVMHNNMMIGHIDYIKGTPKIIPGSKDRWTAYYLGVYRDGKLRINRTTTRYLGAFNNQNLALVAIKNTLSSAK